MWNYQNDIFTNDTEVQGFGSVEALSASNPIENFMQPDSILGLGNRKKKAEKKLAKAEKAAASGNMAKAQKKLDKAAKKIGKENKRDTTETQARLLKDQKEVTNLQQSKMNSLGEVEANKKLSAPVPVDPITLQDAPGTPGSGLSMPLGGGSGGGGDMGGSMIDPGSVGADTGSTDTPKDAGTMDPVVITNRKFNPLIVAAVLFAIIGVILYLKRKK